MPGAENISKWFNAAEIDYFSAFIKLWLSFNAWYRQHYNESFIGNDRNHINIIRGIYNNTSRSLQSFDRTDRNIIRKKFFEMIKLEQNDIEAKEFRKLVEKFLYLFKNYSVEGLFDGQLRESKNLSGFFLAPGKSVKAIRRGITEGRFFSLGDAPDKYNDGDLSIINDLENCIRTLLK